MAPFPDRTPLDTHYLRLNSMYLDRNFYRNQDSIFAHLCEIVGGLSLLASGKQKPRVNPERYMAKALAWWMALCGKMGVRSLEDMLWTKFPGVCPYCHRSPHEPYRCRDLKRHGGNVNWEALSALSASSGARRPSTIADWHKMFSAIYPCSDTESFESTFARLTEELGELAEALRAFPVAPGYFLSEASDFFAWLMHLNSLYRSKLDPSAAGEIADDAHAFEALFASAYADSCQDCRNRVCTCPPILPRTLGRISHDIHTGIATFSPGGALLPTEDALALFQLGARTIRIGSESYDVTGELLREIHSTVVELFDHLRDDIKGRHRDQQYITDLTPILTAVSKLAAQQRINQESIDALADHVARLPSEARSTVLGFFSNVAAGPWVLALTRTIEQLAQRAAGA